MKFTNQIFVSLISILLLVQGCDNSENQQNTASIQNSTYHFADNLPHKKRIFMDSLLIHIPGKDGLKPPEIIFARKPHAVEYMGISEIIPGESYLQQSVTEKFAGELPVMSKKPEIIQVDYFKLAMQQPAQYKPPVTITLPHVLNIDFDSLSSYEKIAVKKGLVSIQHNNTVFPPVSIMSAQPKQTKALPFEHKDDAIFDIRFLDSDQELPNSFIRCIAKDTNDVIWLAAHTGGLISYDGHFFEQYTMKSGLSSDMVISLLIDSKNNFWIGTLDKGLNFFDGKKITRYTKKQGLPSNFIRSIYEDSKGNVWIATPKGASQFNGSTLTTYTAKQGLPINSVSTIYEDNHGNMWFGTDGGGVSKYDGNIFTTFTEKDGLTSDIILSITDDHDGNLWIGTNGGGVSKFDGQTFTNYTSAQGLGSNIILSIIEGSDDNMWFG